MNPENNVEWKKEVAKAIMVLYHLHTILKPQNKIFCEPCMRAHIYDKSTYKNMFGNILHQY